MAENLTDLGNQSLGTTGDLAQGTINDLTSQIPDVPNPEDLISDIPNPSDFIPDVPNPADLIPEIPKIPAIGGLIGSLPLPQFRKPEPVKVEKPPLPRKLEKQSKIPNVPKEPETPLPPAPPTPEGIPAGYRKVVGGTLFDVVNSLGSVAYAKDVGFGQVEVYRIDEVYGVNGSSKAIAGPYRTSESAKF